MRDEEVIETRRRARPRDGVHRRTALPALMAATLLDGNALLEAREGRPASRASRRSPSAASRPGSARSSSATTAEHGVHPHQARELGRGRHRTRSHIHLPETATQADVLAAIASSTTTPTSTRSSCSTRRRRGSTTKPRSLAIDPARTSTGCTRSTSGDLVLGVAGPRPCTPLGIEALLVHYGMPIAGTARRHPRPRAHARPPARGAALAEAAEHANAAVTRCAHRVRILPEYTKRADIVVAAAGSPGILQPDMVEAGCRGRRCGA